MSDEKKEIKCCGCCKGAKKELSNKDLDKVTGGTNSSNGKYVCTNYMQKYGTCRKAKKVDGIDGVCTCSDRTNGICCEQYGNNCTCRWWDKKLNRCSNMFS